jgi:DMSO/TMAO reductase YedYZ molybdopterin-dependent catalytic subunit
VVDERSYFEARQEQMLTAAEVEHGLSRRKLLKLAASSAFALPLLAGAARLASAPEVARAATIGTGNPFVKPTPPELFNILGTNAEMRFDRAAELGYTIPNDRFFIRDHTLTPILDIRDWSLNVYGSGLQGGAVSFTYDELLKLPSHSRTCFVECAGNGRSFYGTQQGTPAGGSQWKLGGIGVAEWTGVLLSDVLKRARMSKSAVDVMPAGLDPTVVSGGVDNGHVRRPMSVDKAMDDVLLAYAMNGETLPFDHGFPLRAVVPGWVGIANIKWVGQIEVSRTPLFSLWNTAQYRFTGGSYPSDSPPLTDQIMKSAFELAFGAHLPAGQETVLTGRSWSPFAGIRGVEVSTDGGSTWSDARHDPPNHEDAWTRWSFPWTPPAAGNYTLMARASDKKGNVQPATSPFNTAGYLFGAVVKHSVVVA